MLIFFNFVIFLLGLAAGSFLNVVICRLETGEGIVKNRSHCPHCGTILRWYDLVPIFSFILLKGRCRYCQKPISWQYPIVEIATASLFLLISNFQFPIFNEILNPNAQNLLNLIYLFFIISSFIIIFVFDLRHYLIPDKVLFPAIGITFLYRFLEIINFDIENLLEIGNSRFANAGGKLEIFLNYFLSALGASVFFLLLVLVTKGRGMGLGDVKLVFLIGLILGWPQIFLALFLAFLSGALVGLGFIAFGSKTLKSQIPFGPFLSGAAIFALLFGSQIISAVNFGL